MYSWWGNTFCPRLTMYDVINLKASIAIITSQGLYLSNKSNRCFEEREIKAYGSKNHAGWLIWGEKPKYTLIARMKLLSKKFLPRQLKIITAIVVISQKVMNRLIILVIRRLSPFLWSHKRRCNQREKAAKRPDKSC